jgi:hypothetical protein
LWASLRRLSGVPPDSPTISLLIFGGQVKAAQNKDLFSAVVSEAAKNKVIFGGFDLAAKNNRGRRK